MKAPVLIEINEEFLKIATGKPFARQRQLADCYVAPISGLTDNQISQAVGNFLRENKVRPAPLSVCIPRNFVTVRNLHLPSQVESEIRQMLQLHIGRIVPYKKEEIVFDYSLVGYDEMNYAKLILSIVHNDVLTRQLNILHAADLFIDRISLSSYAVWEWVMSNQKNEISASEIYLILDFDANFTDFIVCNRSHLLFTRSITVDTKEGLQQGQLAKLIGEVRQSLVIFHNEEMNKNPAKIFLCGAGLVDEAQKMFSAEFDMPVVIVPPPYNKQLLISKSRSIPVNVSLTSAAELLLEDSGKRISFMLPEIQIRKALNDRTRELMILGMLVIYFFSASLAYFWGKFYNQQLYLNKLAKRNKTINEEMGGLLTKYRKLSLVKTFLYQRNIPLAFLYELEKITPFQVAINYLSVDNSGMVTLRGQGAMLSDVFRYISTLENSKFFKDVATKYTRTKKTQDKEYTEFELTFKSEEKIEPLKEAAKK